MPSYATSTSSDRADEITRTALRRELLLAARSGAALQDRIDCATLAIDAGLRHVGRAIRALCSLQVGGLIDDTPWSDQPRDPRLGAPAFPISQVFPFDQAIADLAALMRLRPVLAPAGPVPVLPLPDQIVSAKLADAGARQEALSLGRSLLDGLASAGSRNEVCAIVQRAATDLLLLRPIALDQHVGDPLDVLGTMFVCEWARRFTVANWDLVCATAAAGNLLEQAAALDAAALGPCFRNVRLLIRTTSDLFAMIDAAGGRPADFATVQTWCVLLSAHLQPHQVEDLVDELGDQGALEALSHILWRIGAGSIAHFAGAVHRIRDVALDLSDHALAAVAQGLLLQLRPHDSNEWKILGDIASSADDATQAVIAYERALFLSPNNTDARRNLALSKTGRLAPVKGGYGVTDGRRRLRLARVSAYRSARPAVAPTHETAV